MKREILIILSILTLALTGCSTNNIDNNANTEQNQITEQEDKFKKIDNSEIPTPVPAESYFDSMYNKSEIKVDKDETTEENTDETVETEETTETASEHEVSNNSQYEITFTEVTDDEITKVINQIYTENSYSTCELLDVYLGNDMDTTHTYLVKFNNKDVWAIFYDGTKAFALFDEFNTMDIDGESNGDEEE